ncbi:MAG TPA: hypothetical protein PKA02_02755 [Candidatus Saccharibacteria bacterium]|nr:hypothetical protein [Candidatus Saccharibacteria bacterium]
MRRSTRHILVNEQYQQGYEYTLAEATGENFRSDFTPQLNPEQMLKLGVFGGDYFNEVPSELPASWFKGVKLSKTGADKRLNFFGVNASQPLAVWQKKGWIYEEDPKGWFLWYCRYYMGRRIPEEDDRQIKRWINIKRHASQIQKACLPGDLSCRPRQRQALLHWAYDSRLL